MKVGLTHKGWFGICPVYMNNPWHNEAPYIGARHIALTPLFWFSQAVFWGCIRFWEVVDPETDLNYPIKITGRLNPIQWIDVQEHETWGV